MKALYQESETPEVFTWTTTIQQQAMLAGRVSTSRTPSPSRARRARAPPDESKIMVSRGSPRPGGAASLQSMSWIAMSSGTFATTRTVPSNS